jgi:protein phosphatase methylesterase 1
MSDLAKSFVKTKLASLPPPEPLIEEEDDSSSASSMSSTGTVIPSNTQRPAPAIHWSDYYAQEFYLEREEPRSKFHVYLTPPASLQSPLLVLHHGAGSSAMSFALAAKEIRKAMPGIGILAVEAREHGSVVWDKDGAVDNNLNVDLLGRDMVDMILLTQQKMCWTELPTLVLIGHSLGGAVVTHVANMGLLDTKVLGFAVLDVVEGSAMEALKHMQAYLRTRPKLFDNLDAAIDWHIRSRTLRNVESARASVPSLFMQTSTGGRWVWKTDLSRTESYWENWFTGMSAKFLSGKGAKLLLLAGTDRLDKELMIGQMQGKSLMIHVVSTSPDITQASSNFLSFLPLVTSSRRISLRRRPKSLLSSSSATTVVHWYFLLRSRISSRKARRFEMCQAVHKLPMQRCHADVCRALNHGSSHALCAPYSWLCGTYVSGIVANGPFSKHSQE